MGTRIGIDVGGTFTDIVILDEATGQVTAHKTSSSTMDSKNVARAIAEGPGGVNLAEGACLVHASTMGLKSLRERSGAVVGLLATRGFRDILAMRRGEREEPYDLFFSRPEPLVQRYLRLPITERILATGEVSESIDEMDVERALEVFNAEGVQAIAVAFLNAWANPAHEIAAAKKLRELGFEGPLSLSHVVSGRIREYPRTSTAVVDAYVKPVIAAYVDDLSGVLSDTGFTGETLIGRSGGGAMPAAEAKERPFETLLAGPAAAVQAAAELAKQLGFASAVTADVGGCQSNACLLTDGQPLMANETLIADWPVQGSVIDVRTVGAGGGAIAYIDVGGLLRVAEHGADADPGPACYGRGGQDPTVTDAALTLGLLGRGPLADGMTLDEDKARTALAKLGSQLDLSIDDVASGILTLVGATTAARMRDLFIAGGEESQDASLIAFGGMGPLLSTLLARELGIVSVVIPRCAGSFSAWGLLGSSLTQEASRTHLAALSDEGLEGTSAALRELFRDLENRRVESKLATEAETFSVELDMNYLGQGHNITVPVAWSAGRLADGVSGVREKFLQEYERAFGYATDDPCGIVTVRALVRRPLAGCPTAAAEGAAVDSRPSTSRSAYSFTKRDWTDFSVLDRAAVGASPIRGPVLVTEATTTTYVDEGFSVRRLDDGALLITDNAKEA